MRILNHSLGMIARTNLALWRFRINFVPLNVVVLVGVGALGLGSLGACIDALHNAEAPPPVSFEQIRTRSFGQQYVQVSGMAIPEAAYEYGDKGSDGRIKAVERSWFPLVDADSGRVLLVQHRGVVTTGTPERKTLVGMLRPLDDQVRRGLSADGFQLAGHDVEPSYMLVEGETPGSPLMSGFGVVMSLVLLCGAAIVIAKHHTIFEPGATIRHALQSVDVTQPAPVRAAGRFALNEKARQRFVDVPAYVGIDNGTPVIASNIDASSRFMGITTSRRAGVWLISVRAGSVADGEFGFLYFGLSRRPAFRFSYADADDGTRGVAVIASDDPAALERAVTLLAGGQSSSIPPQLLKATA